MIATFKTADFVANLKAALLAAWRDVDEARAGMCCVRIELAAGVARFVATNGHWLWVNEATYAEVTGVDDKGKKVLGTSSAVVQIHISDVKEILKGLEKGKKSAGWDIELDTAGNVRQLAKSTSFVPVQATFPPYIKVLPSFVTRSETIVTFDPVYIAQVTEAFVLVSNKGACGICIEPSGGDLDPVVVTSDASSALAVLMPRRHAHRPSGADLLAKYRGEKTKKAA